MGVRYTLFRAVSIVRNKDNHCDPQKNKKWVSDLMDAIIVAGMHFFYTLAGISTAQIITEPKKCFVAACISAGLGFFTTLSIKRSYRGEKR